EAGVVEWLLGGGPAVRWEGVGGLLGAPPGGWGAGRGRAGGAGWGAGPLGRRGGGGGWAARGGAAAAGGGVPLGGRGRAGGRGVPEGHPAAREPLERLLARFMPPDREVDPAFLLRRVDLCHLGFWLGLGAYFLPGDARLSSLGEAVLSAQFEDGGWNCHMRN